MENMDVDEDHPLSAGASASTRGPSLTPGAPDTPFSASGSSSRPPALAAAPGPMRAASHGPGGHAGGEAQDAQSAASRRRRGLGVVTPNACTECRKKRSKCDGRHPCTRCKGIDAECVYETPIRQSKENLRHEILTLKRHQRSSEQVFAALVRSELWEEVIQRIRNGQTVDTISEWLARVLPAQSSDGGGGGSWGPASGALTRAIASESYGLPQTLQNSIASTESPSYTPESTRHSGDSSMSKGFPSHQHPGESQSEPMQWTTGEGHTRGNWVENQSRVDSTSGRKFLALAQVLNPELPETKVAPSAWTRITDDSRLVQHLLALYFCWEYPTFASLSKEHFLKDFQDGRMRYCSAILVNAILALGCRFSNQPHTRAIEDDLYSSGDHFFKECVRLYEEEIDHHSLTTVQALGIMSIREASCGRDSESWFYAGQSIRLAFEMGLHHITGDGSDDDDTAVKSATFWGAFALDHAWSLATGTLPQCSSVPSLPPKPAIIDDIEASMWVPYTEDDAPLQRSCQQPSNVRSVYKCFCELSELVHESLYILYRPGRPLQSQDLLRTYTGYLNWYGRIPEVLRLGQNFTPSVLFVHMYYHFATLLLFQPIIKLRIIGSTILPRTICSQAADAIQNFTRSYASLYTLRRTPSFMPYFVLTSAIMHLAIAASFPSDEPPTYSSRASNADRENADGQGRQPRPKIGQHTSDIINRGIDDLAEMAPCHQFAEQALNILRYLARKWGIDVSARRKGKEAERAGGVVEGPERSVGAGLDPMVDFKNIEASTRPKTDSRNFFAPNVSSKDFVCPGPLDSSVDGQPHAGWRRQGDAEEAVEADRSDRARQGPDPGLDLTADPLEYPLFWPFPMQGRPMIATGNRLRESGFEMA